MNKTYFASVLTTEDTEGHISKVAANQELERRKENCNHLGRWC